MEYATRADLDGLLERIIEHLEAMEMRLMQRFHRLEARMEAFESRGAQWRVDGVAEAMRQRLRVVK
jgi:hypothetical protein